MGVRLTWQNNSVGDNNIVYRSAAPIDPEDLPVPLAVLAANQSSYDDLGAVDGETYFYRVALVRGASVALSNELSFEVLPPAVGPFGPLVSSLGPACWLRLNETTGTVAYDSSGNNRHAAYAVSAESLTSAGLLVGDDDRGIVLPPTLTPLALSSAPVASAGDWTFGAIVRPTSVPPQTAIGVLLQLGANGTGCPELDVIDRSGGNFGFRVMASGTSQLFASPSSWPYGSAVVVYLRQSAAGRHLFVNGAAQGNTTGRWGSFTGTTRLGFSRFGADAYPLPGGLDEVQFYGSALSDAQIAELTDAALGTL